MSIVLDDKQSEAVTRCLDVKRRLTGTTGPEGSGKTTIMRTVHEALRDAGFTPIIVAPTGKAARRAREATGCMAMTIHMLLEYTSPKMIDPKTDRPYGMTFPRRTRERPIEQNVVLADEYAMVTHELHRNLIDALPAGGRLLTFGDIRQLPPIEANPVLAAKPTPFMDILSRFDGVVLDRIHRQAEDSGVLVNAARILAGRAPLRNDDFGVHNSDKPIDTLNTLIMEGGVDYTTLDNQIIVPGNNGFVGTHKLNTHLQMMLMESGRAMVTLPRYKDAKEVVRVGVGDKVIMTKNWYELECSDGTEGVFNGESGIVIEADPEYGTIVVDFADRTCMIPPVIVATYDGKQTLGYPQRDMQLAYAVTTHKMQGSECQNIIYILNQSHAWSHCVPNFYTAITRAKSKVQLITDYKSMGLALSRKDVVQPKRK